MTSSDCPTHDVLLAFSIGKLPRTKSDRIARHLEECPQCEATIQTVDDASDTLAVCFRREPVTMPYEEESSLKRALVMCEAIAHEPAFDGDQPDIPADMVPEDLGMLCEYRLLSKLGQGGMGTVYRALHTKLDKTVAVKVLPSDKLQDERTISRFEREMKAVGKLDHPNIVRALDAREVDGKHFLVMEYVSGLDLSRLVHRRGPLPIPDACEIIRQTAHGLQYAHEHGLVHRDIKPSNLMLQSRESRVQSPEQEGCARDVSSGSGPSTLDSGPSVKILDLGLALLQPWQAQAEEADELTDSGQMMGTLDYMAPEQGTDSHNVDIRADIYSLGATLYKLLCGAAPFAGEKCDTPVTKMMALATEPVAPIRERRSDVPDELAAVLDRMLARNPIDRYATPAEAARALAPFCDGCDLVALLQHAESGRQITHQDTTMSATANYVPSPSTETQKTEKRVGGVPQAEPAAGLPLRPSAWRRRPVLLAVAVGLLALFAAAWVVRVATDKGEIAIRAYDPGLEITIRRNEKVVDQFQVKQRPESTSYYSGHFEIEIKGGTPHGVEIKNRQFALKRGDDVLVEIVRPGTAAETLAASAPTAEAPPLAKTPFDAEQAKTYQQAWARHSGTVVEIANSIGMKLRLVPPGEFMMGSPQAEIDELLKSVDNVHLRDLFRSEGPQHPVRLTRAFYLGVCEVTQEEYLQVMGNNPSSFSSAGADKDKVAGKSTNRYPVENVSWLDAVSFCNKLSELEELRLCYKIQADNVTAVDGNGYRLPTEAEWEYACRAGSAGKFCFGDREAELGDYAWWIHYGSVGMTRHVGDKRANGFGLHDMHGNAQEWCADWYAPDYYRRSPVDDPMGPDSGTQRVLRGGMWHEVGSDKFRCAFRDRYRPVYRCSSDGFRVSRTLTP